MRNKDKKYVIIGVVILLLLCLSKCEPSTIQLNETDKSSGTISLRALLDLPESFEELIILSDGEVVDEECAGECDGAWDDCSIRCEEDDCSDLYDCTESCWGEDAACGTFSACDDTCSEYYLECRDFCSGCYEMDFAGVYSYFEIIPSVHAIADDFPFFDCGDDLSTCFNHCYDWRADCWIGCEDDDAGECVECWQGCDADYGPQCDSCYNTCDDTGRACYGTCTTALDDETYEWDRTPVTDVGAFYEESFPIFYNNFMGACDGWFMFGMWVSEPDVVGCAFPFWIPEIFCEWDTVNSFGEVCETIGYEFICEENVLACSSVPLEDI